LSLIIANAVVKKNPNGRATQNGSNTPRNHQKPQSPSRHEFAPESHEDITPEVPMAMTAEYQE
jgi:hypothetical protein